MAIDSSIRVNKLADRNLYLTKGLLLQIKTNIFIQNISNFLSVHHSQKVNCTNYIVYLWNKNKKTHVEFFLKKKQKTKQLRSPLNVQLNVLDSLWHLKLLTINRIKHCKTSLINVIKDLKHHRRATKHSMILLQEKLLSKYKQYRGFREI